MQQFTLHPRAPTFPHAVSRYLGAWRSQCHRSGIHPMHEADLSPLYVRTMQLHLIGFCTGWVDVVHVNAMHRQGSSRGWSTLHTFNNANKHQWIDGGGHCTTAALCFIALLCTSSIDHMRLLNGCLCAYWSRSRTSQLTLPSRQHSPNLP